MEAPPTYVIGGGLAGLTAAASLARARHPVTVLEAARGLGGRARTRSRDGFDLNLGPHAFYRGGTAWSTLEGLGARPRGRRPRYGATKVVVDGDVRTFASVLARDVRGRAALGRLLAGRDGPAADDLAGTDAATWIIESLDDPMARRVAWSVVRTTTYTADLTGLDASAAARQLRAGARGVCYVHGGWQTVVAALAGAVRAGGGRVVTGTAVTAVEHDDDAVRAIHLADGRSLPATAAIVAVHDPRRAAGLLAGPADERVRPAAQATVDVRMAHLDVALRPAGRRLANVLSLDDDVFISVPSDVARVAPHGGMVVTVGRYLRPGEERAEWRPSLEAALTRVRPTWMDDVVDLRYVPSSLVAGDQARVATAGVNRRPTVDVGGVPGLALAGDWIGPVGMLADAAVSSGATAAAAVMAAAVPVPA